MSVLENVLVPDIGGEAAVDVIEILVNPGDTIVKDTPLVVLESDKATMEIPSSAAGVVAEVKVKVGDKVAEGDLILTCSGAGEGESAPASTSASDAKSAVIEEPSSQKEDVTPLDEEPRSIAFTQPVSAVLSQKTLSDDSNVLAGPAARRLAHRLGVNLRNINGTGRKSRVCKEDIEEYVKQRMTDGAGQAVTTGVMQAKDIDFSKFGEIAVKPMNKIKRLTGASVYYAWNTIPHVTQFDSADITDIEAFRKREQSQMKEKSYKLTLLAFVCKVVSRALVEFPQFNSSLDAKCENIIYKSYFNIGIAVETPNGLVVPVIRDVDKLSISEIAMEMGRLSTKAREKGLAPSDMAGGCFTISSLGGIGGTSFTPIVNSPEVAILGLSRSSMQPVYENGDFVPRLMLPLSLSYDHRVIDGAEAARFTRYVCEVLADLRRVLL